MSAPRGKHHRKGRRLPRSAFERVLFRVTRGEKLTVICREPGMPDTSTVAAYRRRNPEFDARWRSEVGRRSCYAVSDAEIEAVRNRVAQGERLVAVCAEPGMPSTNSIRKHRRRNPQLEHLWGEALGSRRGARIELQPARLDAVLDAARSGLDTGQLDRMISGKSLHRLRARDPFFARRYDEARQAGRVIIVRRSASRKLSSAEVWSAVESAVRHIPTYARDDIRGDLAQALYEGRVSPEGAKAATRELMTAWNRQFARRDISMDAEMGEDGEGFTFGALISDGTFDTAGTGIVVRTGGW